MACRELDADAALLSEIRDGREHVRWARGGRLRRASSVPLRDTICERLLDGRIGPWCRTRRRARAERARARAQRHDPRLHRRPVRDRATRAPTCCAAWRARRGRTSARPTCASCRASPRACDRCSSPRERSRSPRALVLLAGCGGERRRRRGRARDRREGARAPAVRSAPSTTPLYVTAPPGDERRVFVVEQGGTIRVVRGGEKLDTPFLDVTRPRRRPAASRACCRWRSRPTTPVSGLFYVYYTDPTATSASSSTSAPQRRSRPTPARRARCCCMPDDEPNHNGGLLLFGPDGLLYIGTGDGGGGGDQHGARRQRRRSSARCSARSCASTRGRPAASAYSRPALEPVRRPLRRARRDLQLRPAQPVALLVRPPDRRPDDRRRRPERGRGDRLRAPRQGPRARTSAGASFEGNDRFAERRARARARSSR